MDETNTCKTYLKGGLAGCKPDTLFDPIQLQKGMKIEMEHTNDPQIAKEIAKDHLTEFPKYYDYLEEMEARLKSGGELIKAYKRGMEDVIEMNGQKYVLKYFHAIPLEKEKSFDNMM